jgi:hypothetical protein
MPLLVPGAREGYEEVPMGLLDKLLGRTDQKDTAGDVADRAAETAAPATERASDATSDAVDRVKEYTDDDEPKEGAS